MTPSVSSPNVVEFLMIGIGVLFLFKRLADIDKQFELRLWVVTFIMTITVVVFFIGYAVSFADVPYVQCTPDYYCQTEL